MICVDAFVEGDVEVEEGTVLHPTCYVRAGQTKLRIGKRCVIEERCVVENTGNLEMCIGDDNLMEVGAHLESCQIGHSNRFAPMCFVCAESRIGNNCVIGPRVRITNPVDLPDNTSVVLRTIPGTQTTELNFRTMENPPERAAAEEYQRSLCDSSSKYFIGRFHALHLSSLAQMSPSQRSRYTPTLAAASP